MMSKAMALAYGWARTRDAGLSASDPRLNHWVYVVHQDGTLNMFRGAFVLLCPGDEKFIAVFTEHHLFHVYAVDDLQGYWELQVVKLKWK